MKMFRSLGVALAVAVGALMREVTAVLEPALRVADAWLLAPALRCVSAVCEPLSCGVAKLHRELVAHGLLGSGAEEMTNSGMRRESNGYRQDSARCTSIQTPLPC